MPTPPQIEDLLDLPESQALRQYLVAVNYQRLRYLAGAAAVVAFGFLLYYLFASEWLRLLAPATILGLTRLLFSSGEQRLLFRYPRWLLCAWLLALFSAAAFVPVALDDGLRVVGVLGPLAIAMFRMPALDLSLLMVAVVAGTLGRPLIQALDAGAMVATPRFIAQSVIASAALYVSLTATRRGAREFQKRFRVEESRHRERLRLRQELASARQIQLSMLPRRDPSIAGFEIAATSLPAAEVGGDYYEYFERGEDRVAIVVGDVAGHGVASGLLLSGIRSCLYLLHGDDKRPGEMFRSLDRMVRDTTERRMFITLLYTEFERRAGRLTVIAAGHPPPLHFRPSTRSVTEIDVPAPPLGTRLDSQYQERTVAFETGDVFLLYTDGLIETANASGDSYGIPRLTSRLVRVGDRNARSIREDLLSDVWNFKGDADQTDDITLVVVRLTEPGAVPRVNP